MKFSKSILLYLVLALVVLSFSSCKDRNAQTDEDQFNPAESEDEIQEEPSVPVSVDKPSQVAPNPPITPPAPPKPQSKPFIPAPPLEEKPSLVAMYYDEAGVFDKDMFIESALIQSKDVHLKNKTVKGDVVIDKYASGNVYLDNVLVEGKIIVESPALSNLYLNDVQCKDIYLNDVGNFFSVEATGKSILDTVTAKDSATFMEYDLHSQCDGFKTINVENNTDPYGLNINISDCRIDKMKIDSICRLNGNKSGAHIDSLVVRRRTEVGGNVYVKDAVNYSPDTTFYNEPRYIEYRADAVNKNSGSSSNGSYNDRYNDRYEKELYEPNMTVYNSNGNLCVEFEDLDPKTSYVLVKLYIDGNYAGSEKARKRSRYTEAEFTDGEGRYDLRYTKKEIKAYAVSYVDEYANSPTVTWRSKSVPSPKVTFDTNSSPATATIADLDKTKYDYTYSFSSTDGKGTDLTGNTINISEENRGKKLYIRTQLNSSNLDATSTGYSVLTVDIPN